MLRSGLEALKPSVRADTGVVRVHPELFAEAVALRLELPGPSAARIASILLHRHEIQVSERIVRGQLRRARLHRAGWPPSRRPMAGMRPPARTSGGSPTCWSWVPWPRRDEPAADGLLAKLRQRYDEAIAFGITHNRHRDWHDGNHPGYTLGCWLRDNAGPGLAVHPEPAVEWTNNISERGARAAKRHQAVSGYWHTQTTLARWCGIRSYLDSAMNHGLSAFDAISAALAAKPWLLYP